ncbi:MAG: hypothetical protein OXO52_11420 [Rhodospirillales bacterium]|nr:hypothetical protein [Rhodospirillales bacterium]MDE0379383.1 hypothetical protein [Rhodospirillales bacterium]
MQTLSPEQLLEIARRVHETFHLPKRWHQGGWGRDDDGDVIEFDGNFHVFDNDEVRHPPAFRLATPESPRCFCLGAAIRIHTGSFFLGDPSLTGQACESMCEIYTRIGHIDTRERELNAANFEPHLDSVIEWNDDEDRSYEDIRELTAAVLRHLDAARFGTD